MKVLSRNDWTDSTNKATFPISRNYSERLQLFDLLAMTCLQSTERNYFLVGRKKDGGATKSLSAPGFSRLFDIVPAIY